MASPSSRSILKPQGERSPYNQTDCYQFLNRVAASNWDDDVAFHGLDCPGQSIGIGFPTSTPAATLDYALLASSRATLPPVEDVAYDDGLVEDVTDEVRGVGPDHDVPVQNQRDQLPLFECDQNSSECANPSIGTGGHTYTWSPHEYSAYIKFQESIPNLDWASDVPSGGPDSHATLKRKRNPSDNISSSPTHNNGFLQGNATSQHDDDVAYCGPCYYPPNKMRRLSIKQEGESEWSRFYRELCEHVKTGQVDISDFFDGKLPYSGSHFNRREEINLQFRSSVGPTSSADVFDSTTSDSRSFLSPQPNSSSCTMNPYENISSSPTDHYRSLQRNDTSLLYDDVSYGGPYFYTPNRMQRFVMKAEGENAWQRSFREMIAHGEDESWYCYSGEIGGHQMHSFEIGARLVTEVGDEIECPRIGELEASYVAQDQYNCRLSDDGPHVHSFEMVTRSLEVTTFSEKAAADLVTAPAVIANSDSVNARTGGAEEGNGQTNAGPPKAPRHGSRERRRPRWLKDYV